MNHYLLTNPLNHYNNNSPGKKFVKLFFTTVMLSHGKIKMVDLDQKDGCLIKFCNLNAGKYGVFIQNYF